MKNHQKRPKTLVSYAVQMPPAAGFSPASTGPEEKNSTTGDIFSAGCRDFQHFRRRTAIATHKKGALRAPFLCVRSD